MENSNSSLPVVKPLQEKVSDFFDVTQTHISDSECVSEILNQFDTPLSREAGTLDDLRERASWGLHQRRGKQNQGMRRDDRGLMTYLNAGI